MAEFVDTCVTCSRCSKQARCVRMSDGTTYRPWAWVYPDEQTPLVGICGGCQVEDVWSLEPDDARVSIGSMPGASSREVLLGASLVAGVLDELARFDAGSCEALRKRDPGAVDKHRDKFATCVHGGCPVCEER